MDQTTCPRCGADLTRPLSLVLTTVMVGRAHVEREERGITVCAGGADADARRETYDAIHYGPTMYTCYVCGEHLHFDFEEES